MAFESCQHTVREIVLANFEKRRYWTLVEYAKSEMVEKNRGPCCGG
jgi:hypothetical protein